MPSRHVLSRGRALSASVAIAAMSLLSGLPSATPIAPVAAADPYPTPTGHFLRTSDLGNMRFAANAGVVNLAAPDPNQPPNPDATTVTAVAGSSALQGAALLTVDLTGSPLATTTLDSLHLESLPVDIPLSTIPINRVAAPHTWQQLLAPTVLAGIPLQNVTWKQVDLLTGGGRPAALNQITLAEVDWSGSVLRDLPLAALTFGGTSVTSIDIPLQPGEPASDDTNAERWCYLLNQASAGGCASPASISGESLIEIGVRGAPLKNIPLKNIPLKNIDLSTSPLKNIPLKNIVLQVAPLKNIPLKNIDFASSPLKNIPLKNIDLSTSPLKNIPLKNIAWATSPLKNIPLKNIDLSTSPLKNIPLKNIDFSIAPLKNIPLKNIDLTATGLGSIPLKNIDFSIAPLKNIPLKNILFTSAGVPTASPLKNIPLKNIVLANAPLKNIPLKNIDFSIAPLKNIPLKNIDLTAAGLAGLPLDSILWTSAPLGTARLSQFSFGGAPLGTIPLAATANPAAIAGCAAAQPTTCAANETLAQAAAASDIKSTATLADIGTAGFAGHGTLNDLLAARIAGSTVDPLVGDLRLDLAGASAPAITLGALVLALQAAGATPAPNPTVDDLRVDRMSAPALLGDIRLDVTAGVPVLTLADLLASLSSTTPDVLLGDIRLDLVASGPALTLANFLLALSSTNPDVTLGDLRLDAATGVDALVLDAISAFLLDPQTFAPYLLGAIGTFTDVTGHDITLGELGTWSTEVGGVGVDITLGDLAQYLDDSVSLADVLLGLVPPTQFPFEDFPVSSLNLDAAGRYIVQPNNFQASGGAPAGFTVNQFTYFGVRLFNSTFNNSPTLPVDLEVVLPYGSQFDGAAILSAGPPGDPIASTTSTLADGRTRVLVRYPSQVSGTTITVQFQWENGLRTGPSDGSFRMLAPDGSLLFDGGTIPVNVEDGAEPNTPQETIKTVGTYDPGRLTDLPVNPAGCSASAASCAGLDKTYIDAMIPGFISYPGDIDWYTLPDVRAGSRISADLADLPLDADLILYGPRDINVSPTLFPQSDQGLPGELVEDSELGVGRAATSIAAQSLADLRLDPGFLFPDNSVANPLTPISISQHRGTDAESVGTIAPVSGDYVVAVTGYNGTTSRDPYLLRARVTTPTADAACPARTFPNPMPAGGAAPSIGANVNAIFLTNPGRLSATYGATAAAQVASHLASLVTYLNAHPSLGVVPAIVPLDAYPAVKSAYDAWDANPCSVAAANGVAQQITGVVSNVLGTNPALTYVTVVGGDDIVPMGRVPDLTRVSNESEYANTFAGSDNPISAAQAASFTLTDDIYGDPNPTPIGDGSSIFVPRIAVGRLVETPAQIDTQLDSFGSNGGLLDTHTGLVAGYDFLADGAGAVSSRLNVGGRTVDGSLIDQPGTSTPWTRAQLLAKLFPSGGASPLVDSINAHYDHTALLPSAGNAGGPGEVVSAADIASLAGASGLAGRVLFTMGCHAGLSVPDSYVSGSGAAADDLRGDWAQTLSAAGVSVYVANTGFGIGDTASIAYSERLMGLYAKLLDGSLTAGQGLAYAKQAYYGSLGAVGVYDLKVLQQIAFYGLPFWRVSTTAGATPPAPPTAPALPGTIGTDATTGLQALPLTFNPSFTEVTTSRGRYWTVGSDDPQVTQYRPIQPRTSLSVVTTGQTAHGALVTALASLDKPNVNPVLDTPTIDLSASSPEVSSGDSAWPGRLAVVTTSQAPYGRAQDLVLVPGQFLGSTSDGTGRQRLYSSLGVTVFYAPDSNTDFEAPTIESTSGNGSGSSVAFTVVTDDAQGAVKRVLVGYHDFDGTWRFANLAEQGSTTTWSADAPVSHVLASGDSVEYFVQVVDASGNVATASNKAVGFQARTADTTAPSITASIAPAPNAAGWSSGASATVSFTCSDDGSGIDAGACPAPVTVTTEGSTLVSGSVTDRAGNTASAGAIVQLDRTSPTISATQAPAPNAAGWSSAASVSVTFTCADDGSGIDASTCPSPVTVTSEGTTTVTRSVTDIAGNQASATATVRIDRTAPTITASIAPTPNAAGWNKGASATVSFACSDGASGIAADACPVPVTVSAEGAAVVTGSVSDRAGNSTSVSATVRLDRTAPTVTLTGIPNPPNGTIPQPLCTTTDGLSGVAVRAALTTSTVRINGIPTTTATCTGATDVAGNLRAPVSQTYVAPMNFTGFLSPIDNPPVVNTGNAGRTYPVKFQLRDAQGAFITVLPAVTSTTFQSVSCSSFSSTTDPLPTDTAGNSGLTYDATANQYVYAWKTPSAAGCYVLRIVLADGSTHVADFKLK